MAVWRISYVLWEEGEEENIPSHSHRIFPPAGWQLNLSMPHPDFCKQTEHKHFGAFIDVLLPMYWSLQTYAWLHDLKSLPSFTLIWEHAQLFVSGCWSCLFITYGSCASAWVPYFFFCLSLLVVVAAAVGMGWWWVAFLREVVPRVCFRIRRSSPLWLCSAWTVPPLHRWQTKGTLEQVKAHHHSVRRLPHHSLLRIQFSIYEPPSPTFLRWLRSEKILVVAAATLNPNATANLNPMEDFRGNRVTWADWVIPVVAATKSPKLLESLEFSLFTW